MNDYNWNLNRSDYLSHHGVLGMRWGVRRYQNYDGSLTKLGMEKYLNLSKYAMNRNLKDRARFRQNYNNNLKSYYKNKNDYEKRSVIKGFHPVNAYYKHDAKVKMEDYNKRVSLNAANEFNSDILYSNSHQALNKLLKEADDKGWKVTVNKKKTGKYEVAGTREESRELKKQGTKDQVLFGQTMGRDPFRNIRWIKPLKGDDLDKQTEKELDDFYMRVMGKHIKDHSSKPGKGTPRG